MISKSDLESGLDNFTGSETWYQHGLVRHITYTDGIKYLADKAAAHWLLDKIATLQLIPKIKREEFQVWRLKVGDKKTATLTCTDGGNGGPEIELHSEKLEFTDFPLDEITIWFTGNTILLPSEY